MKFQLIEKFASVLFAASLIPVFGMPSTAIGGPVQVGRFFADQVIKIENKTGKTATDFHMRILHPKTDIADFGLDLFEKIASTEVPGMPGFTDIDWTEGSFENGGFVSKIGVRLKSKKNEVRVSQACWTGPAIDTGTTNRCVSIPTFKVEGDPIYTISNEMDEAFGIRGLQFLVDVPEVAFADLSPFSLVGFGVSFEDFVLLPGESMAFNVPDMLPGNFMYAQGTVFDAGFTSEQTQFIHGHQNPVPEPPVLALAGLGCLILWGFHLRHP